MKHSHLFSIVSWSSLDSAEWVWDYSWSSPTLSQPSPDYHLTDISTVDGVKIKQEVDYKVEFNREPEDKTDKDTDIDTSYVSGNDTEEYDTEENQDKNMDYDTKAGFDDDRSSKSEDDQWNMVCVPKMAPLKHQFVFKGPKALITNRHLLKTAHEKDSNTDSNKTGETENTVSEDKDEDSKKLSKQQKAIDKRKKYCWACKPLPGSEERQVHKCPECNKILPHCSEFRYHMERRHIKEKKYYCDICNKGFHDPNYIKQHKRTHSEGN